MDRLLLELRGVSLRRNESNSWKWVLNQIGTYSVKATYVVLCDHHFASTKDDVLAHTWNLKVPPKINKKIKNSLDLLETSCQVVIIYPEETWMLDLVVLFVRSAETMKRRWLILCFVAQEQRVFGKVVIRGSNLT